MEHNRELKKPLQNLVYDVHNFGIKLKEVYSIYEKLNKDIDLMVLQYMCRKRKDDT